MIFTSRKSSSFTVQRLGLYAWYVRITPFSSSAHSSLCHSAFLSALKFALLGILLFLPGFAFPAEAASTDAPPDSSHGRPIVTKVRFEGNNFFSDDVLALRTHTKPNRRFLGIPGFTWWLWLYRLGASGSLGERVGEAFMASGEAPAYLDSTLLAADAGRLRLFYYQEGFRDSQIAVQVDTSAHGNRAQVTFEIDRGPATYIRSVRYDGVEMLSFEQKQRLVRGSLLRPQISDRGDPLQFVTRSQRYSESTLLEERRRILTFLRNEGYAAISRDSIRAIAREQAPDSIDIDFRIRPGDRFRFGDVHFDVAGPEAGLPLRQDTLQRRAPDDDSGGGAVPAGIRNERRLQPDMLLQTLQFEPGAWYNQAHLLATKRRLEATNVFSFSNIVSLAPDTTRERWGAAPRLDHRIELRTRRRHQIRLEVFMLQRSGVLAGSDDELGTGVGLSYANANLLGGGESFQIRGTGSVSADLVSDSTLSAQAEVSASLVFPYLVAPFRSLDRLLNLYDAKTRFSFSLLTARRDELRLIIRGRGLARARLEMQHTPTLVSLVDIPDLSLSNPDTLRFFQRDFLDKILGRGDTALVRDPVQRAQILEDYTQPQVNSAFRYTLRSARVNPLRRNRGYSYEGAFEVGGNLPYLFDRFVYSPDSLEGSLPGLPIFRGERISNRLVYRQYVRLVGDLRQYRPIGRSAVLAWKFIGGVSHPTGKANVVPFDRRFYSGGASSVRGWGLRELGPGSVRFSADADSTGSYATNILGGDVKLEAAIEVRGTFLRNILAADWMAVAFTDAGNVWFGPRNPGDPQGRFRFSSFYREFGVGSGVGLRIAWEYLIVRFDLGFKIYDPARRGDGVLPDGLRNLTPHFGIGHTF